MRHSWGVEHQDEQGIENVGVFLGQIEGGGHNGIVHIYLEELASSKTGLDAVDTRTQERLDDVRGEDHDDEGEGHLVSDGGEP